MSAASKACQQLVKLESELTVTFRVSFVLSACCAGMEVRVRVCMCVCVCVYVWCMWGAVGWVCGGGQTGSYNQANKTHMHAPSIGEFEAFHLPVLLLPSFFFTACESREGSIASSSSSSTLLRVRRWMNGDSLWLRL